MCLANLWISEGTNSLAHPFAHPKIIYCAPTICQPLWQMLRQDPSLSKLHIYIVSSKSLLINTLFTINIWNEILRIFEEVVCVYSVAQSCLTFCNCMYCSLPGSSVHGVFQARILEWVTIPFSRGSSQPRDRTLVSCIAADFLRSEPSGKPWRGCLHMCCAQLLQSCLTLCNPMACSLVG